MNFLTMFRDQLWGWPLLVVLIVGSLYLTVLLKGAPWLWGWKALSLTWKSTGKKTTEGVGDLSRFQALMTTLAGAMGTGTIAGVATALTVGGVGAVFWMWIVTLLGMSLKYAEGILAAEYRQTNSQGEISGGPMYILSLGAGLPKTAVFFAIVGVGAALGTGNLVQAQSIAVATENLLGFSSKSVGFFLTVSVGWILLGGIKSVGRVSEKLVPFMGFFYMIGGLVALWVQAPKLGETLLEIFRLGWEGQSEPWRCFQGASFGLALQTGFARGIFASEAGLGTGAIAVAAAQTKHPGEQGLLGMSSVIITILFVCTTTALVILTSDLLGVCNPKTGKVLTGTLLTMEAFALSLGSMGRVLVAISLILFAYSTVLAWAYYGEKCLEFLIPKSSRSLWLYRGIFATCLFFGATMEMETVWTVADICNGLMVLPNVLGLVCLGSMVQERHKDYIQWLKSNPL